MPPLIDRRACGSVHVHGRDLFAAVRPCLAVLGLQQHVGLRLFAACADATPVLGAMVFRVRCSGAAWLECTCAASEAMFACVETTVVASGRGFVRGSGESRQLGSLCAACSSSRGDRGVLVCLSVGLKGRVSLCGSVAIACLERAARACHCAALLPLLLGRTATVEGWSGFLDGVCGHAMLC